jgi:Cu(I)/Ag(I) efflux system membrane fusion protein
MNRRWIVALVTAVSIAACEKKEPAGASAGTNQKDMEGMSGMAGMPGMGAMEGMESGASDSGGVPLDRTAARRLGIRFARVAVRPLGRTIRIVGTLTYAEPRRQYVNARVMGWVERLDADYLGKPVRQGDPLLSLYSPEVVGAQEEYLLARRLGDSSLTAAARRRLALWNFPADQLGALDRTGEVSRTVVFRAPMSGEIAEKSVTQGQAVQPGENLFLIADRSVLWVDLSIYEMDARAIRIGSLVEVTVDALPGRTYKGKITFIHPTLDEKTRTLTARAEIVNNDGALRPGMYVTAEAQPAESKALAVPTEAVLPTGTENLVFVNRGDGEFAPREVVVGARGDSTIEIVRGLKAGDEIVASATYLLDSESNLGAAMQGLMLQMGMGLDMGGMKSGSQGAGTEGMKGMKMDAGAPK